MFLQLQEGTGQVWAQLEAGIIDSFCRVSHKSLVPRSMLGKCGIDVHLKTSTHPLTKLHSAALILGTRRLSHFSAFGTTWGI